jgi:two-component system response regulator TtrR
MIANAPTVFIVDDDPGIRGSLRFLLEGEGFKVDLFESAAQFLEFYSPARPGCLVLDLRLKDMSGLELHEKLTKDGMQLPTLMISGHAEVPAAVRAMKGGVLDFIEKPFRDSDLLDAVRTALERDREIRARTAEKQEIFSRLRDLSERNWQVLNGVERGLQSKVIAAKLKMSEKAVEYHRRRLTNHLGVESASELASMVTRMMAKLGVRSVPQLAELVSTLPPANNRTPRRSSKPGRKSRKPRKRRDDRSKRRNDHSKD